MTNINKIYKCMKCGNLIEKLSDISIIPECCGQAMIEQKAKTEDTKLEKHVPFITQSEDKKVLVKIGENENHPMIQEHYIQFIEIVLNDNTIIRKNLKPGDLPEAKFNISKEKIVEVREFCNLHGLWINKLI